MAGHDRHPALDPVSELITTYNELNGRDIEELDDEPSPLEFMRHVARNSPFVVRGAAAGWTATRAWDARFLREALLAASVNIAVTPDGYVLWVSFRADDDCNDRRKS
jgi:jumonji domain-containing protein 7